MRAESYRLFILAVINGSCAAGPTAANLLDSLFPSGVTTAPCGEGATPELYGDEEAFRKTGDHLYRACGLSSEVAPCTVISIGSRNEWDFEEEVVRRTPCRVETFDCTLHPSTKPPAALRERVRFHHACVGGRADTQIAPRVTHLCSGTCHYLSWASLLHRANVSGAPAFLKMDVEGFEWRVLPEILKPSTCALLPRQIALELHNTMPPPDAAGRRVLPREFLALQTSNVSALGTRLRDNGYVLATRDENTKRNGHVLLLLVQSSRSLNRGTRHSCEGAVET